MTARIDPAATKEAADSVVLEGVWEPQVRPLSGVERVETRVIPMGRTGQRRTVLIEFRKKRGRSSL
jgi:hypothetical protein